MKTTTTTSTLDQTKIAPLSRALGSYHEGMRALHCAPAQTIRDAGGQLAWNARWSQEVMARRQTWLEALRNYMPSVEELIEVIEQSGRPCANPRATAERLLRETVGVECKSMLVKTAKGYELRVQSPKGGFVAVDAQNRNLLVVATLRRHNQRATQRTSTTQWPAAVESKSTIYCTPATLKALAELGRVSQAPRLVSNG